LKKREIKHLRKIAMESVTTTNNLDHQIESNHIDQPSYNEDTYQNDNPEDQPTTKLDNDKELIIKLDNLLLEDQNDNEIYFHSYQSEKQMSSIMSLISGTLSEPYSIYTYRYFIHNWPELCFLCSNRETNELIGAIVSKLDIHKKVLRRGYIAMLAINKEYRRKKIASKLVLMNIREMIKRGCDEIFTKI
jgi:peptide alpha-N-acetyltransferase